MQLAMSPKAVLLGGTWWALLVLLVTWEYSRDNFQCSQAEPVLHWPSITSSAPWKSEPKIQVQSRYVRPRYCPCSTNVCTIPQAITLTAVGGIGGGGPTHLHIAPCSIQLASHSRLQRYSWAPSSAREMRDRYPLSIFSECAPGSKLMRTDTIFKFLSATD